MCGMDSPDRGRLKFLWSHSILVELFLVICFYFLTVLFCLPSSYLSASIWQVTDLVLQSAAAVHHLASIQDGSDANLWYDKNPRHAFCCIVSFASMHTLFGGAKIMKLSLKFAPRLQEMKQSYLE